MFNHCPGNGKTIKGTGSTADLIQDQKALGSLAVGKVVTKEETLPILLDEAFAMYDDDRLAQTLQTLSTLQNQIFLFTCQKREVEMLRKMNLDYNLIEM